MSQVKRKTQDIAKDTRNIAMRFCLKVGDGNLCQALSSSDALAVLFNDVLNLADLKEPFKPGKFRNVPGRECDGWAVYGERGSEYDRFFFSPPHYSTGLYCSLIANGRLDSNAMDLFDVDGEVMVQLGEMASPGFEVMSGSLGQTMSMAGGVALARKKAGEKGRVFVYIGDGECDSGQTWEAVQMMAHYDLGNVVIVCDMNGYQCDDAVKVVMKTDLPARFTAFGCNTIIVDGHDHEAIEKACKAVEGNTKPTVVLCKTNPWNGFEDLKVREPRFHYINFTKEEIEHYLKLV